MSPVGPRPERPEFVAALELKVPLYRARLMARPGLTGWAQISYPYGDSVEDATVKLEYDLYYREAPLPRLRRVGVVADGVHGRQSQRQVAPMTIQDPPDRDVPSRTQTFPGRQLVAMLLGLLVLAFVVPGDHGLDRERSKSLSRPDGSRIPGRLHRSPRVVAGRGEARRRGRPLTGHVSGRARELPQLPLDGSVRHVDTLAAVLGPVLLRRLETERLIVADPWQNAYLLIAYSSRSDSAWVLSAGPNGVVEAIPRFERPVGAMTSSSASSRGRGGTDAASPRLARSGVARGGPRRSAMIRQLAPAAPAAAVGRQVVRQTALVCADRGDWPAPQQSEPLPRH